MFFSPVLEGMLQRFCLKPGGNPITNSLINITIHVILPSWLCQFKLKNKSINVVEYKFFYPIWLMRDVINFQIHKNKVFFYIFHFGIFWILAHNRCSINIWPKKMYLKKEFIALVSELFLNYFHVYLCIEQIFHLKFMFVMYIYI